MALVLNLGYIMTRIYCAPSGSHHPSDASLREMWSEWRPSGPEHRWVGTRSGGLNPCTELQGALAARSPGHRVALDHRTQTECWSPGSNFTVPRPAAAVCSRVLLCRGGCGAVTKHWGHHSVGHAARAALCPSRALRHVQEVKSQRGASGYMHDEGGLSSQPLPDAGGRH